MAALQIVLMVVYPLLIYVALQRLEPRYIALVLIGLLVLRVWWTAPDKLAAAARAFWLPVVAVAGVAGVTVAWNHPFGLLLTPVGINLALLATFGHSLRTGPTMIERFARLQVEDLSGDEIRYCRDVTWIWCGFFVLNGGIALGLAVSGWVAGWALYTGLIAYVAMGVLFSVEYLYRHWRFRRYVGAFTDPVLRRVFPPRVSDATTGAMASDLETRS